MLYVHSRGVLRAVIGVFGMAFVSAPALSADGSWTGNPALLRGGFEAPGTTQLPSAPAIDPSTTQSVQSTSPALGQPSANGVPRNCRELIEMGIATRECVPGYTPVQQQQSAAPAAHQQTVYAPPQARVAEPLSAQNHQTPQPSQPTHQPAPDYVPLNGPYATQNSVVVSDDGWEGDWSVTFGASTIVDSAGWRFDTSILPSASLTRYGRRGDFTLSTGGELTAVSNGLYRVDELRLGGTGSYLIDRDTMFSAGGGLSLSQDTPNTATYGAGVTSAPIVYNGNAQIGLGRRFGRAEFELGLSGFRETLGDTGMAGGVWTSNADRARTGLGLGVRGSLSLTPRLALFADLQVDREFYDIANAGLGAKQDNWTYSGAIGLSANWGSTLTADISAGYSQRQFDSPLLTGTGGFIFGGRLTYNGNKGLTITAALDHSLDPPASNVAGASTRFGHLANLSARYQINDWLATSATVGGGYAWYAASPETETGLNAGAGAEFSLNRHVGFGLDYSYNWAHSSTNGASDSHRISLSTTLRR